MLSLFNLPCNGFCEMSELLTVPCILIGNRQLPPDTTSTLLVELSPQSASVVEIEQSEAARARPRHPPLNSRNGGAVLSILHSARSYHCD